MFSPLDLVGLLLLPLWRVIVISVLAVLLGGVERSVQISPDPGGESQAVLQRGLTAGTQTAVPAHLGWGGAQAHCRLF